MAQHPTSELSDGGGDADFARLSLLAAVAPGPSAARRLSFSGGEMLFFVLRSHSSSGNTRVTPTYRLCPSPSRLPVYAAHLHAAAQLFANASSFGGPMPLHSNDLNPSAFPQMSLTSGPDDTLASIALSPPPHRMQLLSLLFFSLLLMRMKPRHCSTCNSTSNHPSPNPPDQMEAHFLSSFLSRRRGRKEAPSCGVQQLPASWKDLLRTAQVIDSIALLSFSSKPPRVEKL